MIVQLLSKKLKSIFLPFIFIPLCEQALANTLSDHCASLFLTLGEPTPLQIKQTTPLQINQLTLEITQRRNRVHEFEVIRKEAQKQGLRAWLFGGTAAAFGHYVKWDLLRELGQTQFQHDRFDYDYTNIYRSTQDLDIVIDGNAVAAQAFERILKSQFPYFLGSKSAAWEVRSLKEPRGDKGGLLDDFGFMNQHTDSNSTGMIELTDPPPDQSVIRDLRDWQSKNTPQFLKDLYDGWITFYYSPHHSQTPRAKAGLNPPIFSIIRALTKVFQYDLMIRENDLQVINKEISQFDPAQDLKKVEAARWIEKHSKKLFNHAVDIEYAWNTLEQIGLRKKLIAIQNNITHHQSLAWWMNKEPLRSFPVGEGKGKTAESLGLSIVSHETNDFLAYESMTRSHTGTPNVFISRHNFPGETAIYGDGFYTAIGRRGARGTGITIRFEVNPKAREGHDFILTNSENLSTKRVKEGDFIIWKNRNAIRVIPESLNLTPVQYFEFLANGNQIEKEDQSLLWKFKRKLDHSILSGRIRIDEMTAIRKLVLQQLINPSKNYALIILEWIKIEVARLNKPPGEESRIVELIQTKADPALLFERLREISKDTDLEDFIETQWLPSLFKEFKLDLGDRVLETCLFSHDPAIQKIGNQALDLRKTINHNYFIQALEQILHHHRDVARWIRSENSSPEEIQRKAAYLAIHPELRDLVSPQNRPIIQTTLNSISNFNLFENKVSKSFSAQLRYESFQFHSFHFPPEGLRVMLSGLEYDPFLSPGEESHEVTLTKDFEIQLTPVTQFQWSTVMRSNPSFFLDGSQSISIGPTKKVQMNPNRPVENISWEDVQIFLQKLNEMDSHYHYRLPTEAEWAFAAQGDLRTIFSFGDDHDELISYGWFFENSDKKTHDVANLKPNLNGLYDIHGNVWEWTQNWWDSLPPPLHSFDPQGPDFGLYRTLRGGSWGQSPPFLYTARRIFHLPAISSTSFGFRLVRTKKELTPL